MKIAHISRETSLYLPLFAFSEHVSIQSANLRLIKLKSKPKPATAELVCAEFILEWANLRVVERRRPRHTQFS